MLRCWLALPLLIVLSFAAFAAQEAQPIGYVIGISGADDDAIADEGEPGDDVLGVCERDGEKLDVTDTMPVFPGDRFLTDLDQAFAIAFVDECAVTLRPSSALKIEDYGFPARDVPTHLSVEKGSAFFAIKPRPEKAHFFVKTLLGEVEVKGTKFEIITEPDGGGFKTTVAVLQGAVTLAPNGKDQVDIKESMQAVLTVMSTNITGFTGAAVELKQLSKDEVKALSTQRGNAVADVYVDVKKGKVTIKSWNKNIDGSYTVVSAKSDGSVTRTTGSTIKKKDSKFGATISDKQKSVVKENSKGLSATIYQGTLKIQEKFSTQKQTGTASVTDTETKIKYKGEFKVLADGTRVVDAWNGKDKTGSRIVVTEHVDEATGVITRTKTVFAKGATQGTQETIIIRRDGHRTSYIEIVQNTPGFNGDFPTIASGGAPATAAPPPSGPPKVYTTTIVIVPDTRPVSP